MVRSIWLGRNGRLVVRLAGEEALMIFGDVTIRPNELLRLLGRAWSAGHSAGITCMVAKSEDGFTTSTTLGVPSVDTDKQKQEDVGQLLLEAMIETKSYA
jgi:hypothetical protein